MYLTNEELALWDSMVEYNICTNEEIGLVRALYTGSTLDMLNGILFARTGFRNWAQFMDED